MFGVLLNNPQLLFLFGLNMAYLSQLLSLVIMGLWYYVLHYGVECGLFIPTPFFVFPFFTLLFFFLTNSKVRMCSPSNQWSEINNVLKCTVEQTWLTTIAEVCIHGSLLLGRQSRPIHFNILHLWDMN